MHYKLEPYTSYELNHMELEALLISTLTLYCGLFYLTDTITTSFQYLLFVLILLGNAYFIFYWLYWMVHALIDVIIRLKPHLKYYLKRGDAFEEEFYQERLSIQGSYFEKEEDCRMYTFMRKPTSPKQAKYFKFRSMNQLYINVLEEENVISGYENYPIFRRYHTENPIREENNMGEESYESKDSSSDKINQHSQSLISQKELVENPDDEKCIQDKESEDFHRRISSAAHFRKGIDEDDDFLLLFTETAVINIESQIDDQDEHLHD